MIGARDPEIAKKVISSFTQQNEDLVKQLLQLLYYFRGALSRDDMYALTFAERELAIDFINGRMEDAKNMMSKQIPVFI